MSNPQLSLPGVKVKQFFPQTTSSATAPVQAACLIGPIRTVVPGESGILKGAYFGDLDNLLAPTPDTSKWTITSDVKGTATTITVRFADVSVDLSVASGLTNTSNVSVLEALVAALLAAPQAASLIGSYSIGAISSTTPYGATLTILPSKFALDEGYLPSFVIIPAGTGAAGATFGGVAIDAGTTGVVAFTGATASVSHALPSLNTNWSEVKVKSLPSSVLFDIEEFHERFTFDGTQRQRDAFADYVGLSVHDMAFKRDFVFWRAGDSGRDLTIDVTFAPINGTQRVTALDVATGIEYDLHASTDTGVGTPDFTVSGSPVGSAYAAGASVITLSAAGDTLATLSPGTRDLIIRACYVPKRFMNPLPVAKYASLRPGAADVYVPLRINDFTVDAGALTFTALKSPEKPSGARLSYNAVSAVFNNTSSASTAYIDLRPVFSKTVKWDASLDSTLNLTSDVLNAPFPIPAANTDIVVKTASGTVIATSEYSYSTATTIVTFTGTNALAGVNQPLSVTYNYKPEVTFVGTPALTFIAASSSRTALTATSLGGGWFKVALPGGDTNPYGAYSISATVEYPVSPEIQLEFSAERNDLDGVLKEFDDLTSVAADADLADTYAGKTIAPDVTEANPTLHALKIALAAQSGIPIFVGVGEMTANRSSKILQRLERIFDPYDIVPITQDHVSALTYVGAHIDKVIATFSDEQKHLSSGKFRIMYFTAYQGPEQAVVPTTADTIIGTGKLANYSGGGIAFVADLSAYASSLADIQVGDYVEAYQVNTGSENVNLGGSIFSRAVAHRFRIVQADVASPSSCKFVLSDASLPPTLSNALKTFHIERGCDFRIVRVRDDATLADEFKAYAQGIKNRTRDMRQPDFIEVDDDGVIKVLPGYYRSVIEASYRSAQLPHKGMTWRTLPLITGVKRGLGYYDTNDRIHVMTDGGIDYAIQDFTNGPVYSLKQLTTDRSSKWNQNPNVVRVMDFFSLGLYNAVKPLIGKLNVNDAASETLSSIVESFIARMKITSDKDLGGIIVSGRVGSIDVLDDSETNAGVAITVYIRVAQQLEEIRINLYVDNNPTA